MVETRSANLRGSVVQVFEEVTAEKRPAWPKRLGPVCVYWRDDKVASRVASLLGWKRLSEHRLRRISGTVAGLIKQGMLVVHIEWPHGNRGIVLA